MLSVLFVDQLLYRGSLLRDAKAQCPCARARLNCAPSSLSQRKLTGSFSKVFELSRSFRGLSRTTFRAKVPTHLTIRLEGPVYVTAFSIYFFKVDGRL